MSLYNGPVRGGARGGADQFSWDAVKADKDREFYLGHSVKALAGRWQKGKDPYWYTREKGSQGTSLQDEVKAVKAREEEAMLEALGLKPKTVQPLGVAALDQNEMAQLLKRGQREDEHVAAQGAMGVPGLDVSDKASGLGFSAKAAALTATTPKGGLGAQGMELGGTMAGVGIPSGDGSQPRAGPASLPGPPPLNTAAAMLAMARAGIKISSEQLKRLNGVEQKAVKKARKEAKKAKRAAKKATKEKKKRRRRSSSSSSGSDDGSSSDGDKEGYGGTRGTRAGEDVRHVQDDRHPRRRHDSPEAGRHPPSRQRHDSPDVDRLPPPRRRHDSPEAGRHPPARQGHDSPDVARQPSHRRRHDSPEPLWRSAGEKRDHGATSHAAEDRWEPRRDHRLSAADGEARRHWDSGGDAGQLERRAKSQAARRSRSRSRSRSRGDRGRAQGQASRSPSGFYASGSPSRGRERRDGSPRRRVARHDTP